MAILAATMYEIVVGGNRTVYRGPLQDWILKGACTAQVAPFGPRYHVCGLVLDEAREVAVGRCEFRDETGQAAAGHGSRTHAARYDDWLADRVGQTPGVGY